MNVYKLFPTTVIEFDLRGYPNKHLLLKYIQNSNIIDHGLINKGKSSFGKEDILLLPQYQDLKFKIDKCIKDYTDFLLLSPNHMYESWFNILEKDGRVEQHHHGGSIISGAYYPLLEDNTCKLVFATPLYSAANYLGKVDFNSPNFYHQFVMPIKQDYLYLWPGWLEHKTEINKSKKRIVISFNTKLIKN